MEIIFALQVLYWVGKVALVGIMLLKAMGWF